MAQQHGATVAIGSRVRIRGLRRPGPRHLPPGIEADDADRVIAIVAPEEVGLHRLSPRMPLARALLGHRAGDIVSVRAPGAPRGWPVTILAVGANGAWA
jgi:transcription elongation GreA/GreB family factor